MPHSIWCKKREGVFAGNLSITGYDEVGRNKLRGRICPAPGYGERLFVNPSTPGDQDATHHWAAGKGLSLCDGGPDVYEGDGQKRASMVVPHLWGQAGLSFIPFNICLFS